MRWPEAGRFLVRVGRMVLIAATVGSATVALAEGRPGSRVTWTAPADTRLDQLEAGIEQLASRS